MREIRRVGVVGCGFFARNHLNAWRDLKAQGVELVAVCDLDAAKAEAAAREFGVPAAYSDVGAMLKEARLDLVDIVTQVGSHRRLAQMTLGAGIPTIVQKPFASSLDDCAALTDLSGRTGVPLAVHENFRFQLPMRAAKAAIEAGRIGKPNWARISFRTGYDIYAGQPYLLTEEKFVINDLGAHVLDLARFFLGEVEHLTAETQRRRPDLKGEDTATMLLRHKSGAVSVVECTYQSKKQPDPFPETVVELEGDTGAIVLGAGHQMNVTAGGTVDATTADPELAAWMSRPWHVVQESVLRTCEHVLHAYREGRSPSVAAAENLKTMALCDAAYEAAASGALVRPKFN